MSTDINNTESPASINTKSVNNTCIFSEDKLHPDLIPNVLSFLDNMDIHNLYEVDKGVPSPYISIDDWNFDEYSKLDTINTTMLVIKNLSLDDTKVIISKLSNKFIKNLTYEYHDSNIDFEKISWPKNLDSFMVESSNINVPDNLPENLTHLTLCYYLDTPVKYLPAGLKELYLDASIDVGGYKTNINNLIDPAVLPPSLEIITVPYNCSKSWLNKLPKSIKIIKKGDPWDNEEEEENDFDTLLDNWLSSGADGNFGGVIKLNSFLKYLNEYRFDNEIKTLKNLQYHFEDYIILKSSRYPGIY